MAFVNFKTCCSDTKQLIRLVLLLICICVSCYQLTECFRKIQYPPISTHYGFYLNDSLRYPAITICRNPPYKKHLFEKYGFNESKEIHISSTWRSFKYDLYTLQQFFEETTYSFREIIKLAALDQKWENIRVSSSFALRYGRCFHVTPKKESINWGSEYGYLFWFHHAESKELVDEKYLKSPLPGFHVFIQNEVEKFTEKSQQADVFKEYIYVETGDGVQVNIKMNKYHQLPTQNVCNSQYNYSQSSCIEDSMNTLISESVGCSTPWIPNENLPPCNTYEQTKKIVEYSTPSLYLDRFLEKTDCDVRCNATTYVPYVQFIRQVALPTCGIKIYFSSNLYTQMEEIVGYDWNAFLSDLGGSLGFLLGLSVLGMIGLAEELIAVFLRTRKSKKNKELNNETKDEDAKSESTVVVETRNDFVEENQNSLNRKNKIEEYKMDLEFYSKNDYSKEKY